MDIKKNKVSLAYLFFNFLKIGAFSFGGFSTIVSIIRTQFIEKDKILENNVLLDAITISTIMPGPWAVNTVTYVGFSLRGFLGGLLSLIGILLPSFILMCFLAYFYLQYGSLPSFYYFFLGAIPAICAVIFIFGFKMTKLEAQKPIQYLIIILALLANIFFHSPWFTIFILFMVGWFSYFYFYKKEEDLEPFQLDFKFSKSHLKYLAIAILPKIFTFTFLYLFAEHFPWLKQMVDIFIHFSKLSLGMFGGGYVAIPSMHSLVVEQQHWLSSKVFSDAIILGQITPGPILISSAFFGYKVLGVFGALAAGSGMFFPPAILMMIASVFADFFRESKKMKCILMGVRPAIIGLIFSAIYTISKESTVSILTVFLFLLSVFILYRFKINPLFLVPISGFLTLLLGLFKQFEFILR